MCSVVGLLPTSECAVCRVLSQQAAEGETWRLKCREKALPEFVSDINLKSFVLRACRSTTSARDESKQQCTQKKTLARTDFQAT